MGTAFPLDPPLDRQGGTGPRVGARCRRPTRREMGGRRDGGAESRPHRCPRGILGANGLEREAPHCLGCEARGEQVSTGRAAPHARRLHTLKSHDAGTSQATTQLFPGVFQHGAAYGCFQPAVHRERSVSKQVADGRSTSSSNEAAKRCRSSTLVDTKLTQGCHTIGV